MSADLGHMIINRSDTGLSTQEEATEVHVQPESPYQPARSPEDLKRKRSVDAGFSDEGEEDLRSELKRLRRENEEKDSRLKQLEAAVMALQQRR